MRYQDITIRHQADDRKHPCPALSKPAVDIKAVSVDGVGTAPGLRKLETQYGIEGPLEVL